MKQFIVIIILLIMYQLSYAGGLSAWHDVMTPHNNTLDCDGGYDVDFCFSYDLYKQLGDSTDVPFGVSFREFAFCGDYLIAKGLISDQDSVFYIINEVHPEILEFYNEENFKITLQKLKIKEPWSWNDVGYGLGYGMYLIFLPVIIFAILVVLLISLLSKIITHFSNKKK